MHNPFCVMFSSKQLSICSKWWRAEEGALKLGINRRNCFLHNLTLKQRWESIKKQSSTCFRLAFCSRQMRRNSWLRVPETEIKALSAVFKPWKLKTFSAAMLQNCSTMKNRFPSKLLQWKTKNADIFVAFALNYI